MAVFKIVNDKKELVTVPLSIATGILSDLTIDKKTNKLYLKNNKDNTVGDGVSLSDIAQSFPYKDISDDVGSGDIAVGTEFTINSFTISSKTAQKGANVDITLDWDYNKEIDSQSINGLEIDKTLRQKKYTSINKDTTYTLNATYAGTITKTKSVSIKFYNGIYYGKSTSTTYDSTLINSLQQVLSDNKNRDITVTANEDEYIYYCIPSRLGTPTFIVNGFSGGFARVNTLVYTNSSGYGENYDIYRSDNDNLGETTITIK